MNFFTSLSIRNKLVLTSALIVTISLALLSWANIRSSRLMAEELISVQTRETVDGSARQVGNWTESKATVLNTAAGYAVLEDPLVALEFADNAGDYLMTYFAWPDKRILFSVPQEGIPDDFDPTSRPWYQQAVQAGELVFTPPYLDIRGQEVIVTVAAPTYENGRLAAVVGGDIRLNSVIDGVRAIRPTENSFAYLVDQTGAIIAHPNPDLTLKPATEIFADFNGPTLQRLAADHNTHTATTGGAEYWLSARGIPGTDWVLVVAVNMNDALAGARAMQWQSLVTSALLILITTLLLAWLTRHLLRRLGALERALHDISSGDGDLTQRLDQQGNDELSRVGASFNLFVEKIANTLRRIRHSADNVNLASREIAAGNLDLSARTEGTAASLQETASAMEELTSTVRQTADSSNIADSLATEVRTAADHGGALMTEVEQTMAEINESANRIHEIVSVIDGIAFQTNILALNAAVEAARAGQHGQGFAVVASEVRSLAQRSAQAAREIKQLIEDSTTRVSSGASHVSNAGQAMKSLVGQVQRVSDLISEIRIASNEQSQGIGQIGIAVGDLDNMTQQNAALVQQSSAAAESLRDQAQMLAQAVAEFKLESEHQASAGAAQAHHRLALPGI